MSPTYFVAFWRGVRDMINRAGGTRDVKGLR